MLRHVTTRAGVGTAYVRDRAGADVVVDVTASGTVRRFAAGGEATHPALSAAGDLAWAVGGDLRLVASGGSRARVIRGPRTGRAGLLAAVPRLRVDRCGRRLRAVAPCPGGRIPEQPVALLAARGHVDAADAFHGGRRPVVRRADTGRAARRCDRVRPGHRTGFGRHAADVSALAAHHRRRAPGPVAPRRDGTSPGTRRARACGTCATARRARGAWRPSPPTGRSATSGAARSWSIRWTGSIRICARGTGSHRCTSRPRPRRRVRRLRSRARTPSSSATSPPAPLRPTRRRRSPPPPDCRRIVTDAAHLPALVRPGVSAVEVLLPPLPDPEEQLATFRSELPSFAGWSWLVAV